jgi:pimeloyl-ACP methyl ester carboxylesterase
MAYDRTDHIAQSTDQAPGPRARARYARPVLAPLRRAARRPAALLALALLWLTLTPATAAPAAGPPASLQSQGCQERILVLLDGIGTTYDDVSYDFAYVTDTIGWLYNRFLYFSYNPNNARWYTIEDTYQPLARSADALRRLLAQEIRRCNNATFDLIGHSLGGVVAIEYLRADRTTPEAGRIRNLITLNSPVNGLSPDQASTLASILGNSPIVRSQAARDLAALYQSGAAARNVTLAEQLRGRTLIRTLASSDDWFVPANLATIAGYGRVASLGNDLFSCISGSFDLSGNFTIQVDWEYAAWCVGHMQVLSDTSVLAELQSLLSPRR